MAFCDITGVPFPTQPTVAAPVSKSEMGLYRMRLLLKFRCPANSTSPPSDARPFYNVVTKAALLLPFRGYNYSASRLRAVFHPISPPIKWPLPMADHPQKIGSRILAPNRMGNGDEASGDGYKYRGRGCHCQHRVKQLQQLRRIEGVDTVNNPDLVAGAYPLASQHFSLTQTTFGHLRQRGPTKQR